MTPKIGNLDDLAIEKPHPLFKPGPTTEDRVRELIEWAEQQPPETFED